MFWILANILLFAIRQTAKVNMLQNVVYLNICHIILITALTVLTFLSSSAISKKMEQIKMTCEIEYERFEEDTATFCLVSKIKWI